MNIHQMNSGANIVASQDKAIEKFIKAQKRGDSFSNTTHWGGARTGFSQYGSVRQSESNVQASSSNAITKFGEMTGGFGFLNQVGREPSREKTPYQGSRRPRPDKINTKLDQYASGHKTVIGLKLEKGDQGLENLDVQHVLPPYE